MCFFTNMCYNSPHELATALAHPWSPPAAARTSPGTRFRSPPPAAGGAFASSCRPRHAAHRPGRAGATSAAGALRPGTGIRRREAAHALRYVLGNFARHAASWGERISRFADAFSSVRFLGLATQDAPVATPRTWLLRVGWKPPAG